jgi:hypothetical protein
MRNPQDDIAPQRIDIRVPERRLRCTCGRQVRASDFDITTPHLVRAVCQRCHNDLFVVETR